MLAVVAEHPFLEVEQALGLVLHMALEVNPVQAYTVHYRACGA